MLLHPRPHENGPHASLARPGAGRTAAGLVLLALGADRPLEDDLFGGVGGLGFFVLGRRSRSWSRSRNGVGGSSASRRAHRRHHRALSVRPPRRPGPVRGLAVESGEPPIAPLLGLAVLLFPDGGCRRRASASPPRCRFATVLLILSPILRPGRSRRSASSRTRPASRARPALAGRDRRARLPLPSSAWCSARRRPPGAATGGGRGAPAAQARAQRRAAVALVTTLTMATWWIRPHDGLQLRMVVIGSRFPPSRSPPVSRSCRYRLYDIDLVINRTARLRRADRCCSPPPTRLTALALGIALGRGSAWATAGATLVVAVAFRPLRARGPGRRRPPLQPRPLRRACAASPAFLEDLRAGRAAPEEVEPRAARRARRPRRSSCASVLPDERACTSTRRAPGRRRAPGTRASARRSSAAGVPLGRRRARRPPGRSARTCCAERGRGRRPARSRSPGCASSCAASSPRSRRRGRGSSPPATRSGGGSSATCTTARSSGWSRSGWRCATPSTSSGRRPTAPRRARRRGRRARRRDRRAARARPRPAARRSSTPAWRRRCASSPAARRCRSRSRRHRRALHRRRRGRGLLHRLRGPHQRGQARAAPRAVDAQRRSAQNGALVVSVSDDGVGRRAPATGSGLSGLARPRRRARRARCASTAPPAPARRSTAELPCGS